MVYSDANTPGPYPPHQEHARIAKRKVVDKRTRSHEPRPNDQTTSVNPEDAASKNIASAYPRSHLGSHPVSLSANPGMFRFYLIHRPKVSAVSAVQEDRNEFQTARICPHRYVHHHAAAVGSDGLGLRPRPRLYRPQRSASV